jgi:hypothetical protein
MEQSDCITQKKIDHHEVEQGREDKMSKSGEMRPQTRANEAIAANKDSNCEAVSKGICKVHRDMAVTKWKTGMGDGGV